MTQFLEYLSEKYKAKSIDEVNRRLLELSSLFEISQLLNTKLDLSHILNNLLLIPMGRLLIPQGMIFLKRGDFFKIQMVKGLPREFTKRQFPVEPMPQNCFKLEEFTSTLSRKRIPELVDFGAQNNLKLLIPFISQSNYLGGALFGAKLNKTDFTEEEVNFLVSLANIASTSIENAIRLEEIRNINLRLDHKIQELRTLFDIAQGLSATLDFEKVLKLLTFALMGQMLIVQYIIFIYREDHLTVYESKGMNEFQIEILLTQLRQTPHPETATLTEKINDTKLKEVLRNTSIQVVVPLKHQNKRIGCILLGPKINGEPFLDTDLEFLTTLVNQAVISLENARLFKETLEKQRMEEELNLARSIQSKLLPRRIPEIQGYDVFGLNIPSKQVGGDYFDIIPIDDSRVALAIGDVSGKSVPAALLMANLQAALRMILSEEIPLASLVGKLNNLIHTNTDPDRYITFFIGILHPNENWLQYVNAGHNPPIFLNKSNEVHLLEEGGIILGMIPDVDYQSGEIRFAPDDLLVCYTDGVNEAINPADEEFGEERLIKKVKTLRQKPTQKIAESIVESITEFSQSDLQADDLTLLIARRLR